MFVWLCVWCRALVTVTLPSASPLLGQPGGTSIADLLAVVLQVDANALSNLNITSSATPNSTVGSSPNSGEAGASSGAGSADGGASVESQPAGATGSSSGSEAGHGAQGSGASASSSPSLQVITFTLAAPGLSDQSLQLRLLKAGDGTWVSGTAVRRGAGKRSALAGGTA